MSTRRQVTIHLPSTLADTLSEVSARTQHLSRTKIIELLCETWLKSVDLEAIKSGSMLDAILSVTQSIKNLGSESQVMVSTTAPTTTTASQSAPQTEKAEEPVKAEEPARRRFGDPLPNAIKPRETVAVNPPRIPRDKVVEEGRKFYDEIPKGAKIENYDGHPVLVLNAGTGKEVRRISKSYMETYFPSENEVAKKYLSGFASMGLDDFVHQGCMKNWLEKSKGMLDFDARGVVSGLFAELANQTPWD